MMRYAWAGDDAEAEDAMKTWISQRLWDDGRQLGKCTCMAILDDDDLRAIVAYHNYSPHAGVIEITAASEGIWLTKGSLYAMYDYPFNKLNCQMVVQRNDPGNHKLNGLLTRLGFKGHLIPRLRGRDKGDLIMTLTVEDWRDNQITKELN